MCGRFTLTNTAQSVAEAFDLPGVPELAPRYNIAPSQEIGAVRQDEEGARSWAELRWGLIPSWSKDPARARPLINARSETAAEKPSFRQAMARRRCLVPASGFFEWKGKAGAKQPFLFRRPDHEPIAIAGLFEVWHGQGGEVIESVTLLTTEANARVRPVHDRMPVILDARDFDRWLDREGRDAETVSGLMVPCPADWLESVAVDPRVNNARFDDPRCIEPFESELNLPQ